MPMLVATAAAVFIVAAQQENLQPHGLQRRHGLGRPGLDGVRRRDHPHGKARHGQEDGGLALPGQPVLVVGKFFGGDTLLAEKGQVPQERLLAVDFGLHPHPRYGLKVIHPGQGQILGLGGAGDGLGQGMLGFFLQGRGMGQDRPALQCSQVWTSVTWGAPRVRVPVLSKTTVVRRYPRSRGSPPRMRMPSSAPGLSPP